MTAGATCDDVFVDLGSGAGRALLAAAEAFGFRRVLGIELMQGYNAAAQLLLQLAEGGEGEGGHHDAQVAANAAARRSDVRVVHGDFLETPWADEADIVFASTTVFDEELMRDIAELAAGMRPGAVFISLDKPLPSDAFEIVACAQVFNTWGTAVAYIQKRV